MILTPPTFYHLDKSIFKIPSLNSPQIPMRALPSYLNPSIKTLLKSLRSLILAMAAQPREKALALDDPPFDPSKPAVPISYPIKKLDDLLSRSYFDSFHFPFNKASTPLPLSSSSLTSGPRILVCHDMEGGYVDDKWVQGGTNSDAYAIWHWYLIDVFVYFSHNLVTIPPPCWTNAAHTHGVKVLGTFITEWDEGKAVCDILLSTKENAHLYAERLSELAVALGFDGWLMNMEVDLDSTQIPNLKEFVSHLTKIMHSSAPGSLVIWYDSVTKDGNLSWQNQLNEYNKPFFDICDGIFVNYSWEEDYPKLSASVAGERKFDVYMGIDVFGRGTYGGGQWTTNVALDVLKKDEVSAAIFAPGWVYETKQPPDFQTAQNRWWGLVEKSWGIVQNYPKLLPFFSSFDQGRGLHISSEGLQVSSDRWNNISCQTFQPVFDASSDPAQSSIQASVNFKDGSYSGGVCISFKGTVKDNSSVEIKLFKGDLPLGDLPVHITYSVNLDGNALLGLSLGFSKATERVSIFLAPRGRTFPPAKHITNKFSKVITPLLVTNSGGEALEATGWTLQQTSIKMKNYSLTDVNAVCYKEHSADLGSELSKLDIKPDSKSTLIIGGTSDFSASLGHISIRTSGQNMEFPPAASWEVTAQFITWGASSQGAKTVSLKINWKLKEGPDESSLFLQYNIYVRTSATRVATATPSNAIGVGEKYLGVGKVGSFYVSDLLIPTKVSNLLFIIQVCGLDGGSQKLDHSPTFQLAVTG